MSRLTVALAAAAVLAFSWLALAQEAADTFNLLYGNDLKRVAATRDTADDLALAQQLLEAAKTPKTDAALIALLCEKAYELALKDPKGAPVAVQAMELAAAKVAARKGECLEKIVAVRQQEYAAARGDAKTKAAEDLLLALDTAAEAKAEAGDLDGAGALYRRALAVAVTADAKNRIKAKIAELAARQKTQKQVADLKAKVEANPGDAASRNELIRLCLVELDTPPEAAKFLSDTVDEATRKYVPTAARPVTEAPEYVCLELGDWYITLSDNASESARPAMLARAAGYYKRFLELHKADDASATKATLALKKAEAALEVAGGPPSARAAHGKGPWIDLLRLADPARDAVNGKWARLGEALTLAPTTTHGRIMIPVAPLGSYELQVKFVRVTGRESVDIILPVGSAGVVAVMSGWAGAASGLSRVNGRSADANETKVTPGQLENGREYTAGILVKVEEDQAVIAIDLDGRPYIRWSGPHSALSVEGGKRLPDPKALGVGGSDSDIVFRSVRLRMLSGAAKLLRP